MVRKVNGWRCPLVGRPCRDRRSPRDHLLNCLTLRGKPARTYILVGISLVRDMTNDREYSEHAGEPGASGASRETCGSRQAQEMGLLAEEHQRTRNYREAQGRALYARRTIHAGVLLSILFGAILCAVLGSPAVGVRLGLLGTLLYAMALVMLGVINRTR